MDSTLKAIEEVPKDKRVIVFDLDGTLTESKVALSSDIASLLTRLMVTHKVAIIGGGSFEQFKLQVLDHLPQQDSSFDNLFLLPLDGGSLYSYENGEWKKEYTQDLSTEEKQEIFNAFQRAFKETGYVKPRQLYGEEIEDRGSQITFSALGQNAPLDEKTKWSNEHGQDRLRLTEKLEELLSDMEAKVAGLTSIDVTKKGIDKKFGIEQLVKHLNVPISDVLFVGDAFEPDGNDTPALGAGVSCFAVKSIEDTKKLISTLLE